MDFFLLHLIDNSEKSFSKRSSFREITRGDEDNRISRSSITLFPFFFVISVDARYIYSKYPFVARLTGPILQFPIN